MEVIAEESGERADDGCDRNSDTVAARDERDRDPRQQRDLDRSSGRAVEEIRQVRRQRDEQRVGDDTGAGNLARNAAAVHTDHHDGERATTDDLHARPS